MENTVYLVFYALAVPATVILILQTVLLLFGLGHNADADVDSDTDFDVGHGDFVDLDHDGIPDVGHDFGHDFGHDVGHDIGHDHDGHFHDGHVHDSGLRLFTVRGMVAVFAVGGWAGIAALELGAPQWLAVIAALVMGCAALVLVALFFKWALSLQSNGTVEMSKAVGNAAEVYMTVPANNSGKGKINVIIQEKMVEMDAVTNDGEALKYGTRVTVTGMADGNTAIVTKA